MAAGNGNPRLPLSSQAALVNVNQSNHLPGDDPSSAPPGEQGALPAKDPTPAGLEELRAADVAAIVKLLATAADPDESLSLSARQRRLLEGMTHLIQADAWVWLAGVTNVDRRGESMAISLLDGGWLDEYERANLFRVISHPALQPIVGAFTHEVVWQRQPVTRSRDELFDDQAWQESEAGQAWRNAGFNHFLASVHPLASNTYSGVGFYRRLDKPAFTSRDRAVVHVLFQQVAWIHQTIGEAPSLTDAAGLSPREREVMMLLLHGDSRKTVAAKLQLSVHTVADHLKQIYRKLGVTSRAELMAKFIHGGR